MKDLYVFFNELRNRAGAMWVDGGELRLLTPKEMQTQEVKNFLLEHKDRFIHLLTENRIFSKQDFAAKQILSDKTSTAHYPLSFAQERLWFIENFEEGTDAYHIPEIFELASEVDVSALKYALQQVVARHEILRTTIEKNNGTTVQKVHEAALKVEEKSLSDQQEFIAAVKSDIAHPFDLANEYPLRTVIYTVTGTTYLLINVHHIASDGWSSAIFHRELFACYNAYVQGDTSFALPALSIQYKDFALWQREYLQGETLDNQLAYWKTKLSGFQDLDFPSDYQRPAVKEYNGSAVSFCFSEEVSGKIRELSRKLGVTLQSIMLSSMNILLQKYTGQRDIVLGTPIANRHHKQIEDLIGFFVNTQVQRTVLQKGQSFEQLVQEVHADQVQAQLYQDLPFEKLVDELNLERDPSRNLIFQVLFAVQGFSGQADTESLLKPFEVDGIYDIEKFDLSIIIDDSSERLSGNISYATSLFREETINRLATHYQYLLGELLSEPENAYDKVQLLSEDEYETITKAWNDTAEDYDLEKTVCDMFRTQASKSPDHIALVHEGHTLTYKELDEKSDSLAHFIIEQYSEIYNTALPNDTLIALCMGRGLDMVVAMLAIQKAGAAYVPLDPEYPQNRIDYILEDTKAAFVITQRHINVKAETSVLYAGLTEELYNNKVSLGSLPQPAPGDTAYVIYTSGTTGKPKGVMVGHQSLTHLQYVHRDRFGINESTHVLQYASLVFDASVWETFSALTLGATLHIASSEIRKDATALVGYMEENKISHVTLPPALLSVMPYSELPALTTLIVAGEACPAGLMSLWSKGRKFFNAYGPTETTVCATMHQFEEGDSNLNIGKPLANTSVYVLDSNLQPVPAGVVGELYVGGSVLAKGYHNRPELNAERFITNTFDNKSDKLYKTGDLVKWTALGTLQFAGRNDEQVKIRGHRIELGEIEQVLAGINEISQACVVVKERTTGTVTTKDIVAYYVAKTKVTHDQLTSTLVATLPDYMVPAALVQLEAMPLTINGKVDKRALPDPEFNTAEAYTAPVTDTEKAVCDIWQNLLGVERIGITDDFFKAGGNSILAIQASHHMTAVLGRSVKVVDIFKHKSIARLLAGSTAESDINITRVEGNTATLSFAQERLYFIQQYEKDASAYNIPTVYELEESTSIDGIKHALQQIVSRHEVLRSTMQRVDGMGESIQVVHDTPLQFEEVTLTASDDYDAMIRADIKRPFDLNEEYPMRARFYHVQAEDNDTISKTFLLINTHHIARDGWSTGVFEKEFLGFYEAFVTGDTSYTLPALEIQYKDYAQWQRDYLKGEVLEGQVSYWKDKLAGYEPLELPLDFERPAKVDYRGGNHAFKINKDISNKLRKLAQVYGVSLHSVMLSSINILLSKYTGQNEVVIGSLMANRQYHQTENLIGFFVNSQAIRTQLEEGQSYEALIRQVYDDQVEAQQHQDLPFEKLIGELGVQRNPSKHPVFQVIFTLESLQDQVKVANELEKYLKDYQREDVYEVARFDLTISVVNSEEELECHLNYARALFTEDTMQRMADHYLNLLEQLVDAPAQPYHNLSLLGDSETQKVLTEWSSTGNTCQADMTIADLFDKQAKANPDKVALSYSGSDITYGKLKEQSDKLANYLVATYQVKPGDMIGMVLNRSDLMVVSILGILKAGAAYVCLDPEYPVSRKEFMIGDTGLNVLITETDHMFDLAFFGGNLFAIDLQLESITLDPAVSNVQISAEDLAYIIYTSGTTGQPKGVMVSHRAIISLVQNDYIKLGENEVFAFLSSPAFDASTFELFTPLLLGHKLVIPTEVKDLVSDVDGFKYFLEEHGVSNLWLTKTLFENIYSMDEALFENMNCLIIGGEALNKRTVTKLANSDKKPAQFLNGYGPTESTTFTCTYDLLRPITSQNVPIGKPINNRDVYILDVNMAPVPVGVVGELYIGGAGLAHGYLNRPELTVERFVSNPFAEDDASRLYKTGDLVRWLADGNIEYIGRNDDQVKIRGHRIELGETENALLQLEGIKQACVLAKERETDSGITKYLAAYYVAESDVEALNHVNLQAKLSEKLPEYMVPAVFVPLEVLPFTINGKLDKDSLPEPDFNMSAEEYVQPETKDEIELAEIWKEVLKLERVGVTDNFFRIGGDSILSIRLVSKMKYLGYDVVERDIFDYKTIREVLNNVSKKDRQEEKPYIPFSLVQESTCQAVLEENGWDMSQVDDIYPLSYLQAGMLIESLATKGSDTYHDVLSFSIDAAYDAERFEAVWTELVQKHEQLRTAFVISETGYLNIIHKEVAMGEKISIIDQFDSLQEYVDFEKNNDLDHGKPGIFRLAVMLREAGNKFDLVISLPHAITDGWSVASVASEFVDSYVHGKPVASENLPPYGKYISLEQAALNSDKIRNYWKDYLASYEIKSQNLTTKTPDKVEDLIRDRHIGAELDEKVLKMAKDLEVSPDVIFLAIYNLVLSMYYNTEDMVIGTVVNNRLKEDGGDRVFGLHLNTMPVRIKKESDLTMREYILNLFSHKLDLNEYKIYPYAKVKADFNVKEDFYRCSFNYINFHVAEENYANNSMDSEYSSAKTSIPFTLHVNRYLDTFQLRLSTNTGFIDEDTLTRFGDAVVMYLEQVMESIDKPVRDYKLLKPAEWDQIVTEWSGTDSNYPKDRTLTDLFEEQAATYPEELALVSEGRKLTYREVNEKCNQLAHHIRYTYLDKMGTELTPDTLITLFLDRSEEMLIGMLAVLKAGGAYVPMDPQYPQERIDFMLEDTGSALVLTQGHLCGQGSKIPADKAMVIDLNSELYHSAPVTNPEQVATPDSIAYVIYTSGTTGQPKGVKIQHHAAVYYLLTFRNLICRDHLNVCSVLNYCFDASLPTLLSGVVGNATTHIVSTEVFSGDVIARYVEENGINTMRLTPSLLDSLDLSTVTRDLSIVLGGEKITYTTIGRTLENSNITLYNQYGPTESTVGSTVQKLSGDVSRQIIGRPYPGKRVYVLDGNGQPVPAGVTGELHIGGEGLATGYHNREQLTAERFISNKFANEKDEVSGYGKLYKTGDLVRWTEDGRLEYVGRNDDQIKVRGYRIELGEVEVALAKVQGVRQSCVLVKERMVQNIPVKYLVGYFITEQDTTLLSAKEIQEAMAGKLPNYMVPEVLIRMEEFPTTVNGKLDKRRLPDPDFSSSDENYKAPENELEEKVCNLWSTLLGVDRVGTKDDFFMLGGNSILAIQVSHQMTKVLDYQINVVDVFMHPTISGIIDHINSNAIEVEDENEEMVF